MNIKSMVRYNFPQCNIADSERHDKQMAHNPNGSETKSTLACFTKRAKCMTLSVLETSLPMQRSHDTLTLDIYAQNWCAEQNVIRGYMAPNRDEPMTQSSTQIGVIPGATWPQAICSQAISPFGHSAMSNNSSLLPLCQRSHITTRVGRTSM